LQNGHKYVLILFGDSKMFATTRIIQRNTILPNDTSLERYNGRKVIITVLEIIRRLDNGTYNLIILLRTVMSLFLCLIRKWMYNSGVSVWRKPQESIKRCLRR